VTELLVFLSPWIALACLIIWDVRERPTATTTTIHTKGASSDFKALIEAIQAEGRANRAEESQEDQGKRFRDYFTLFFVIATTVGVFYQAYIFSGQLNEMKSSGEQTGQLIENNAKLAIAASKQAEAAERQAIATAEYASVTRDSLIESQRAWVGPRNVRSNNAPLLQQPLDAIVEYQNTGRDPATETIRGIEVFTATKEENQSGKVTRRVADFTSKCVIMWQPQSATVVYPTTGANPGYELTARIDANMVDEEVISGAKSIYISGCFVYKTFQTIHRSWFCYYYNTDRTKPANWTICEAGNSAD
jgi:hypothetical protein